MTENPYQPINGEIVDIIDESPTIKTFVVVLEKPFGFETGQFVELTLPGEGEAPFGGRDGAVMKEESRGPKFVL